MYMFVWIQIKTVQKIIVKYKMKNPQSSTPVDWEIWGKSDVLGMFLYKCIYVVDIHHTEGFS